MYTYITEWSSYFEIFLVAKKSRLLGVFLGLPWAELLVAFIIILLAPTLFQAVI